MPTQGDLFIGEPAKDRAEAEAIYRKLGIDGRGAERTVTYKGRQFLIYIYGMQDVDSYERAVAFNLTRRYRGAILDIDRERTDPFTVDPQDLANLLAEVRTWWPDAKVFLWTRCY